MEKTDQAILDLCDKYRAVFDTPQGTIVFHDLGDRCFVSRSLFSPDPLKMAHAEGMRTVFLHICDMLRLTRAELAELAEKAKERAYDRDDLS